MTEIHDATQDGPMVGLTTEPTSEEEPRVVQCGVCCALVPQPCLGHHLEWHANMSNLPDAHEETPDGT